MGQFIAIITGFVLFTLIICLVGISEGRKDRLRLMRLNQERLRREQLKYREAPRRIWGRERKEPKIKKVPITIKVGCKKSILCPLCRDDLGDQVTECSGCGAMFHDECLEEMGARCSTLGCRKLIDRVKA